MIRSETDYSEESDQLFSVISLPVKFANPNNLDLECSIAELSVDYLFVWETNLIGTKEIFC